MKNSLLSLSLISLISILATGCGQNVEEHHVKKYVLAYEGDNPRTLEQLKQLTAEFNTLTGSEVLHFSDNPEEANSIITLTEGLQSTDGKVGWGQWITETQENNSISLKGAKTDRMIDYSMRLEFDKVYFENRIGAELTSEAHYDLQKLFFHEVGHGLKLPHSEKQSDLMYYEISGKKEFNPFFEYVRNFFN